MRRSLTPFIAGVLAAEGGRRVWNALNEAAHKLLERRLDYAVVGFFGRPCPYCGGHEGVQLNAASSIWDLRRRVTITLLCHGCGRAAELACLPAPKINKDSPDS